VRDRIIRILLALAALGLAFSGARGIAQTSPVVDNRVALVVGVSDYGPQSLENPLNDARLIEASLANTGFQTELLLNPTRGQLRAAVNNLAGLAASKGRNTSVAFYFAGHAVQFDGENWLIPTGADLFQGVPSTANFEDSSVRAQWVLDRLSESGVSRVLLILDACRNNPFRADRRGVGEGNGLVRMTGLPGGPDTMIIFAAEPRFSAFDGDTGNSPFSRALAGAMVVPGLDISEVFDMVRTQVRGMTDDRQRPHVEGLFRFQFKARQTIVASPPAAPPQSSNRWTRELNPAPITATGAALNQRVVVLIYGEGPRGGQVYSYVRLTLARLSQLRAKLMERDRFELSDYGEILASGFREPDDATRQLMAREKSVADAQRR
jgi:hypothetical protein